MLHPVYVGGDAVKAHRQAALVLFDVERNACGERHAQDQRSRPGNEPNRTDDAARRWRARRKRHYVGCVDPGVGPTREPQPRLSAPATIRDRGRPRWEEPVVRAVGNGLSDGQAVGCARVRGVVIQDDDGGMRAIDGVHDERPHGARRVRSDNRLDDGVADQLRGQPRHIPVTGHRQLVSRCVRAERAHAPRWLFGQRVGNEPYRSLSFHAESHACAWRRTKREPDPLTRWKGERVGGRETRRVDPCGRAHRRLERLRDTRDERRLALLRAPPAPPDAGACDDVKTHERIVWQRHPRKPTPGRVHRNRLAIH